MPHLSSLYLEAVLCSPGEISPPFPFLFSSVLYPVIDFHCLSFVPLGKISSVLRTWTWGVSGQNLVPSWDVSGLWHFAPCHSVFWVPGIWTHVLLLSRYMCYHPLSLSPCSPFHWHLPRGVGRKKPVRRDVTVSHRGWCGHPIRTSALSFISLHPPNTRIFLGCLWRCIFYAHVSVYVHVMKSEDVIRSMELELLIVVRHLMKLHGIEPPSSHSGWVISPATFGCFCNWINSI